MADPKKSKIEPVHVEEAVRLKALFEKRANLSQLAFGERFDIGSQGMVWQYLNARSALNVEAALKFARGLDCAVSEFSPRLSEMLTAPSGQQPAPGMLPLSLVNPARQPPPEITEEERIIVNGYRLAEPDLKISMLSLADSVIRRLGHRQEDAKKA